MNCAMSSYLEVREAGQVVRPIDWSNPEEVARYQEFRYSVMVEELGWVAPPEPGTRREYDRYDRHAVHFGAFVESTGEVVGCARLILPSSDGLQVVNEFPEAFRTAEFDPDRSVEISRLLTRGVARPSGGQHTLAQRIYRCFYTWCAPRGRDRWYAVIEKRLVRALRLQHFPFRTIGEGKWYQDATCYPVLLKTEELWHDVGVKDPETWAWYRGAAEALTAGTGRES